MLKRTTALMSLVLLVSVLISCNPTNKPTIIVQATINNGVTNLCIKGSGYTANGPLRVSMTMPTYTIGGNPGPNPVANPPFGNATATSSGGFQLITSLSGASSNVCDVFQGQTAPSEPVLLVVDETTLGTGAAGLPPGFMCGSQQTVSPPGPPTPIPPPPPFGDPSACH